MLLYKVLWCEVMKEIPTEVVNTLVTEFGAFSISNNLMYIMSSFSRLNYISDQDIQNFAW